MLFVRKICQSFARKTKTTASSSQNGFQEKYKNGQEINKLEESSKNAGPSPMKISQDQIVEKDIQEQFEPFSYDQQVQAAIKQKVAKQLKQSYEGQDPTPHKLVNRPSKGAAWGLGGQLMLASKKVQLEGLKNKIDDILQFLELHQVKNIYVHDFHKNDPENPQTNRRRYHIIGSCFSCKHCWKTGTELKNAFNLNSAKSKLKRKIEYDPIYATMIGQKDQEWAMVQFKEYEISLMTVQQRQAMDLEWKWNNPVSEEVLERHAKHKVERKWRRNQFEDLK